MKQELGFVTGLQWRVSEMNGMKIFVTVSRDNYATSVIEGVIRAEKREGGMFVEFIFKTGRTEKLTQTEANHLQRDGYNFKLNRLEV